MSKAAKQAWFKPIRWSYIAINWKGALTYIPFVAYLIAAVFIANDHSSSIAYTCFLIFPQWIAAALVMEWFAAHKS